MSAKMLWVQRYLKLPAFSRGFHLITHRLVDALPELRQVETGLLHVFLQHTSASLTINENADPDVRADLESAFSELAPENADYIHTIEGPDDMPAHIKAALLGCSLTIPVAQGRLALGTWQGITLCEHRDRAGSRNLVLTLFGQSNAGSMRSV
jgi:secondary thiamine-phosphate synthase enzyme